jgi:hypothetical protein
MPEFGDRIRAQRDVLRVVNAATWTEPLLGLSHRALQRWTERNAVPADSELARQLRRASERLGFLANRSQMQVSDEYHRAWREMQETTQCISETIRSLGR